MKICPLQTVCYSPGDIDSMSDLSFNITTNVLPSAIDHSFPVNKLILHVYFTGAANKRIVFTNTK